ncbi:Sporulation protein [Candidatus Hydrogenisulfobacillus filiaventi]|uniref:Sporulation protein n=1 Tax=Candidatus Hydrogenisulfobacillus filiaventi TaxID=2707344 RepID=A0A6F8ZIS2_9FIRM|nr:sporulation protein YqfC [Bacillota bacterium]CAB1129625.1 Sporulation protein [Candidatus Hydrogenisulfobacillus filiaventi]
MATAGRTGTWARLSRVLDVPPEVFLNVPRVELVGRLQLRLENHRGLEFFLPTRLVLATDEGRVLIEGRDLAIGWIDRGEVLVTGQVQAVRFLEARKR